MSNWYLESGKNSNVVISSRIRFARNFKNIPFLNKMTKEDFEVVIQEFERILPKLNYEFKILRLKDMDDLTKLSLIEKNLISPDFLLDKSDVRAIIINKDENICIMLNEEDHIRLQVFSAGLDIKNIYRLAEEIDEKICKNLDIAFSEKYGYLTSCPSNVGTGLRVSAMMHLPGLEHTGNIKKVLNIIEKFGMNIRGMYGEGTKALGNIYQKSNKQTLGISENETVTNINEIIEKIIEQEKVARKLLEKDFIELEDEIMRSYGILKYCKKISYNECIDLMSDVRLGNDLGIIDELNDKKINELALYTKPAILQKRVGRNLNEIERDIQRANLIKEIINQK